MRIVSVDPVHPDPAVIADAAARLRAGELVAFPTETVYGLGAHALDARAVRRIYEAKGRPSYNPLIVHVAAAAEAGTVAREWPEVAARLAAAFWPGPLTLVVPRRPEVPDEVTAGLDSVAVRVPAHPVALALLRAAAIPLAAPSANRSTQVSPTTARHVAKSLGGRLDLVLDAGPSAVGIESTVVDVRGERPTILRPGVIGVAELEPIVGEVRFADPVSDGEARASPGMMDRHYAPRARVLLFDARSASELTAARDETRRARARGERVGAIVIDATPDVVDLRLELPAEVRGYARQLYDALHAVDDAGCALVLVQRVPDAPPWRGIRDRLQRAAR